MGSPATPLFQQLRASLGRSGASDLELIERYARSGDEQAFADLVARHGRMVLDVCRRVLRRDNDAHDAFQATFVVLARKAGSTRWHTSLAAWLHDVAYRVSCKARVQLARQERRDRQAASPVATTSAEGAEVSELRRVIDEELARMPERYRLPLLLCCLQDHTLEEAAQQLGWSITTVKGRLQRGREQLRVRLKRRGVLPALGSVALLTPPTSAAAWRSVFNSTLTAVSTGDVAAPVAALAEGVLRTMMWKKLMAVSMLFALAAVGGSVLAWQATAAGNQEEPTRPMTVAAVPALAAPQGSWRTFVDPKALANADLVFVGKVSAAQLFEFPTPGILAPAAGVDYAVTEVFKGKPGKLTLVQFPIGWTQYVPAHRYMARGSNRLNPDLFANDQLHLVYVKGDVVSAIRFLKNEVARAD